MIRRTASRRRRIAARRPLRLSPVPLGAAELWALAALLRAHGAQVHLDEIEGAARRAGQAIDLRDVFYASRQLARRGLCQRHGHHRERLSLLPAGRVVAELEADHLLPARPAPGAVEVWRCGRALGGAVVQAAGGAR